MKFSVNWIMQPGALPYLKFHYDSYAFRRIFLSARQDVPPMEEKAPGVVERSRIKTKIGEDPFISDSGWHISLLL